MTPDQQQAYDLKMQGFKRAEIAEKIGKSHRQVKSLLSQAAQYMKAPEGQRAAVRNSGLSMDTAKHGWRKIPNEDGTSDSVFWKSQSAIEAPEDVIERISERLNTILAAPTIINKRTSWNDVANFVPLFDVHLAMRIGDFGTDAAVKRLRTGVTDVFDRMPAAKECFIVNGGDFTHQNDDSNQTPRNKHPLPVDDNYLDTTDIAVDVTVELIELALSTHDNVTYKALRGNHDENTPLIMRAALRQRYRNEPRVNIIGDDLHFFSQSIGENAIFAAHGDIKKSPKDLCMGFIARYKQMYGASKYAELHTGHRHHWAAQDFPGMMYEQHRAITPSDTYAIENLYDAPSQIQAITYKLSGGRFGTTTHAF